MSKATTAGVENNEVTAKVGEVVVPNNAPSFKEKWVIDYWVWYTDCKEPYWMNLVSNCYWTEQEAVVAAKNMGRVFRVVHIPGEGATQ